MKIKNDFQIRRAGKDDLDVLGGLLGELFAIEEDFTVNKEKQISGLNMLIEKESRGAVFVLENANNIVGMCSLQFLISTSEGGKVGLIEDLIIRKEWRRKKLGSKLLSHVEGFARRKNLLRLQLLADKKNSGALNFYERVSFCETKLICLKKLL